MKKILFLLLLILSLIFVFTSCSTTFDGYSYNIDDARKNESSFYEDYDYFFPTESNGDFIDFLICGKQLRIVKFDTKEQNKNTLYQIKSKATFLIDEALLDDTWTKTGAFPFQVEWQAVCTSVFAFFSSISACSFSVICSIGLKTIFGFSIFFHSE